MSVEILREIPDEDLPKLRDLFQDYRPYALHAYYWIDNYIDWKQRNISNINFFCPDGKWDDGTFIAIEEAPVLVIFVFSLEKSCERLRKGLSETKRIKWDEVPTLCFLAIHESFRPTVEDVITQHVPIVHRDTAHMWWIPKEKALKYDYTVPSEVYIGPLKVQDAEIMNEVWPHKGAASLIYIKTLITANGGFGLYLKQNDTLCSWVLKNNYGGIALLQTTDEHKRKGYGTLLAKYFSKHWAQRGIDIFGFIMVHNAPSLQLFQKIGYRREHGITWIHCKEKI